MEFEFIPIDYDYFDYEDKNFIRIIGRNQNNEKVCLIDSYEPNFYVILKKEYEKNIEKLAEKISKIKIEDKSRNSKVEKVEILNKSFLGKKVKALRVYVTNHKDAHEIASLIGDSKEIEARREYDIPLITKYIKEKSVLPLRNHEVKTRNIALEEFGGIVNSITLDKIYFIEKIKLSKNEKVFSPNIMSYDIETDDFEISKGKILMISLYSDNFKKVLTWKKTKEKYPNVEYLKDESEMIEKFTEYVNKVDPDILTGYFSDGFDLPYLKNSADKNKIKLEIGLDKKGPSFSRGRIPSGKITGIVHVDLFRFIDAVFSQYLESETLSLGDVANELIGETKNDFDFNRLKDMKESDWKDFLSYNLQDAKVTYNLAKKIWPDMLEFTKITQEPLFEISRNRMATHVENYLIHNLDKYNEIIEKRPLQDEIGNRRSLGSFEGAFVFEPKPGLYEKIVFFDFTSMYASVIVSYNLSKSTLLEDHKFSKKEGFFPRLLSEIISLRKKYKEELKIKPSNMLKARSNAYKLLANASYGYQAFFGARYYCREAASSTARLAKENILKAIEKIKKENHKIIYSDTDSIAFLQENKSKKEILQMLKEINSKLPGIMELDLEDFYFRGLFVSKRTTNAGAKKKYALINEDKKLKIRGFETVRRDWCNLSRKLQSEIIRTILEEGNEKKALEILKEEIKRLKQRKIPLEDLIIKTKLKKPLKEYLAEGPHVIAAKKMKEVGLHVTTGMTISYYIGENSSKGKRIGDKVYLPDEKAEYNIDYYLNNQILPAVENILEVFGVDVHHVLDGEAQKKLF